jgi:hypothetical protein
LVAVAVQGHPLSAALGVVAALGFFGAWATASTVKTSTKTEAKAEEPEAKSSLLGNRQHLKQSALCSAITLREKNQAEAPEAKRPLLDNHLAEKTGAAEAVNGSKILAVRPG